MCKNIGIACDTVNLVKGRAGIGPELNQPNTIDGCIDGTHGVFRVDKSLDRIVVRTVDATPFMAGKLASIDATIFSYSTADRGDFYYAADALRPDWKFIGTMAPTGPGVQSMSMSYILPHGSFQAVRVSLRFASEARTSCPKGIYDDVDDIVFSVDDTMVRMV